MTSRTLGPVIREFTEAELDTLQVEVRAILTDACSGCSYEDVAQKHGLPVGTVKSRINRARAKIARLRAAESPS